MQWSVEPIDPEPTLPETTRYRFGVFLTNPEFPATGDDADRGTLVPFADATLFQTNLSPDRSAFDITFQAEIGGPAPQLFQLHGLTLGASLGFDLLNVLHAPTNPILNPFEASLLIEVGVLNADPASASRATDAASAPIPVFSVDFVGAATPIPRTRHARPGDARAADALPIRTPTPQPTRFAQNTHPTAYLTRN